VRQRQHGPRVVRIHARVDLEPHRQDAHLIVGHGQRALILGRRRRRLREPPLRRVPAAFSPPSVTMGIEMKLGFERRLPGGFIPPEICSWPSD